MTGTKTEKVLKLGCDPQVTVKVVEDDGSLQIRVTALDPATDIDALAFNLTNQQALETLTVYPGVDIQDVTGFQVEAGGVDSPATGVILPESLDVGVQFGTEQNLTSEGDINNVAFNVFVLEGENLTMDDIDLDSLTAVVNSEGGNGLALTPVTPDTATEIVETVQLEEDFDHLWSADHSDAIKSDAHWIIWNDKLTTTGCNDGALQLTEVRTDDPVKLTFDAKVWEASKFDNSGYFADELSVEVRLDNGDWVKLDTFKVNDQGTALVGDQTGQTIGEDMGALEYSGGILDDVTHGAEFRIISDFTSYDEILMVDNLQVTTLEEVEVEGGEEIRETVQEEDFDRLWWSPDNSEEVVSDGHWDVRYDQLYTSGHDDGRLTFKEIQTDKPVELSFDAKAWNVDEFETSGHHADSLKLQVQIDNGDWVTLDDFVVNDQGTALVGSETGQEITGDPSTLNYGGGVLEEADENVQFRLVSDLSARNEVVKIDNWKVETVETTGTAEDPGCNDEDFEVGEAGDTASDQFEGFTVSGQKAGDEEDSANDAMIFDTDNPTGRDDDLGYDDQGKAIILSEDGDASDPDDNAGGGTLSFTFDDSSTIQQLTLLDIEEEGGSIDLYDIDGELLNSVEIPAAGNNSAQDLAIETSGVSVMDVNLAGSGAVDNLCWAPDKDCQFQYGVGYKFLEDEEAPDDEPEPEEDEDEIVESYLAA